MNIDSVSDKEVAKLEKKLKAVYLRAQSETQAKMEDYLRRFAVKDAIKQEQVKQKEAAITSSTLTARTSRR